MTEVVVGSAPVAPLGAALKLSLETYQWGKDLVAKNKTVGPRMAPLFDFTESTTKKLLDVSPIKLERVIDGVDTRVGAAVTYGSDTVRTVREAPGKIKNKSLTAVHDKLNNIKVDKDEASPTELGFSTVADDFKTITSERISMMLDASEGYLAQYLPISEEDKEEIKVEVSKGELKPLVWRAGRQSKVAARRLQEQVVGKLSGLKARTTEVVHVDLLKYSAFLDKQKSAVASAIYGALEAVDQKALQPVKSAAEKGASAVKSRVLTPARERIGSVRVPFQDNFVRIWSAVGDSYENKVAKPRAQIVEMYRKELVHVQELERERCGIPSGDDLPITVAIMTFTAALRTRVSKEFDSRVVPSFKRWMGGAASVDEDEAEDEDKQYDDEEEEDSD